MGIMCSCPHPVGTRTTRLAHCAIFKINLSPSALQPHALRVLTFCFSWGKGPPLILFLIMSQHLALPGRRANVPPSLQSFGGSKATRTHTTRHVKWECVSAPGAPFFRQGAFWLKVPVYLPPPQTPKFPRSPGLAGRSRHRLAVLPRPPPRPPPELAADQWQPSRAAASRPPRCPQPFPPSPSRPALAAPLGSRTRASRSAHRRASTEHPAPPEPCPPRPPRPRSSREGALGPEDQPAAAPELPRKGNRAGGDQAEQWTP